MATIHICDYGVGNIQSVVNAFERIEAPVAAIQDPDRLSDCAGILLPGVGAFGEAIAKLREKDFEWPIREHVAKGKPMLGICVGMQMLADVSTEFGEHQGLGLINGRVERIEFEGGNELPLPHMGWNVLNIERSSRLLADLPDDQSCYFAHSYHFKTAEPCQAMAMVDYGSSVTAVVEKENLFGAQFHPEKSQNVGLAVLQNFVRICAAC